MTDQLPERLRQIKVLLCDVDGTLTDGRMYYDHEGNELKVFYDRDGSRIKLASKAGLKIFFITTRPTPAVEARARDRNVERVIAKADYTDKPLDIFEQYNVGKDAVAYIGNDINDLKFMRQVGVTAAVADAAPEVVAIADYVAHHRGGRGAVAEFLELIFKAQGKWEEFVK